MKKLAILVLFSLAVTGFVFAEHDPNDELVVKAKISSVFDVAVTEQLYGTNPLELDEAGANNVKVGAFTVKTNSRYWKLKVNATDNGNLKAVDTDTYLIPFGVTLRGNNDADLNWADDQVVLATAIGAWGTAGVSTSSAFTKRTTPGGTDSLDVEISYNDAATNGANWVAKTTAGLDLVYTATVTITASVF